MATNVNDKIHGNSQESIMLTENPTEHKPFKHDQ